MKTRTVTAILIFMLAVLHIPATAQNLGIGTTSPQQRLHIAGQIAVDTAKAGLFTDSLVTINKTTGAGGVLRAVSAPAVMNNYSWGRLGNTGTNPAINFLGTTDNQPVRFRLNNIWAGEWNAATKNFFIGDSTGARITTGTHNTGMGGQALKNNTTGYRNTAAGFRALLNNTTGFYNTGVGGDALVNNLTGSSNTAIGQSALFYNTTGMENTALGFEASVGNSTGSYNGAAGYQALLNNTTGNDNVAFGYRAMYSNLIGEQNTALGREAAYQNSEGFANVAIGYRALQRNLLGDRNVVIGASALANFGVFNTFTNDNNIAIGFQAGSNLNSGNNNIIIGANAQTINTVINNQIIIGNAQHNYAQVPTPWIVSSDRRLKTAIRPLPLGLNMIRLLQPVDYLRRNNTEGKKEMGFIAQNVQQVLQQLGYTGSGMVTAMNSEGILGVRYNDMIPVLVKAMQEQQRQIEQLQATVKQLIKKRR